jgi:hypothetical protein
MLSLLFYNVSETANSMVKGFKLFFLLNSYGWESIGKVGQFFVA